MIKIDKKYILLSFVFIFMVFTYIFKNINVDCDDEFNTLLYKYKVNYSNCFYMEPVLDNCSIDNLESCNETDIKDIVILGNNLLDNYYSCMSLIKEEQAYIMVESSNYCKENTEKHIDERFIKYNNEFDIFLRKGEILLDYIDEQIKNNL